MDGKQQDKLFPLTFDLGVSMTLKQWYEENKARYGENAEVEEDGVIGPDAANVILIIKKKKVCEFFLGGTCTCQSNKGNSCYHTEANNRKLFEECEVREELYYPLEES